MAAPKTAYSKQDIKATVSGKTHRLGRMPKALAVYGSDAKMKGLFSLDKVLHTKDSGGTDCVIGCVSANTSNYKMHASKRLGHLRITSGTTGEFILLTDGGLNTLPYANANTMFKAATNFTFFSFDNKGTYYQPTNVTLHAKNPSNQWIMSTNSYVLPSGSTAYSATTTGTKGTLPIPLSSGVTYTFYVYGANQEGTYSGTTTMTYKPMGPCKLVNVHQVSSVSDNPLTGVTYDALIFYDYYLSSGIPSGEQPNLYNLFAANTGVTVNTKSLINKEDTGVIDVQVILWAEDVLPNGLWYGFPSTYDGSDKKIVQISNGYPIKWYNSTYNPIPATMTVLIYGNCNDETDMTNIEGQTIFLEGYQSTFFNGTIQDIETAGGIAVTTSSNNLQHVILTIDCSNLDWNYTMVGRYINVTVSEDRTGLSNSVQIDWYDRSQGIGLDLGDIRNIYEEVEGHVVLDISITVTAGH